MNIKNMTCFYLESFYPLRHIHKNLLIKRLVMKRKKTVYHLLIYKQLMLMRKLEKLNIVLKRYILICLKIKIACLFIQSLRLLPTKRPRSAYALFLATIDRGEADIRVLIFFILMIEYLVFVGIYERSIPTMVPYDRRR